MTVFPPCEKSTKRCNKPSMNIINTKEHLGASRAWKCLAQRKYLLILEVMLQSGRFLSALTCILHSQVAHQSIHAFQQISYAAVLFVNQL